MAAGQAQRLYEQDPFRRVAICGLDGRVRWHEIWNGNPILATPTDVVQGEDVQRLVSAPNARPYIVYPFTAQTGWTFNRTFRARDHIAKIYLTSAERRLGENLHRRVGPYVLIEPYTKHLNLRWPLAYWQQLVETHPKLTFVQHTHPDSPILSGVVTIPATFRQACGLIASALVYVRSESGLLHAAAALGAYTVAIWGACMDWEVLGNYPRQLGIVRYDDRYPCGQWAPCSHCQQVMSAIKVETVAYALRQQLAIQ